MQVTIHDEATIRSFVSDELDKRLAATILTPQEAAQYMQVSMATLNRWIRSGKLTPSRLGKVTRFTRASLDELMAS